MADFVTLTCPTCGGKLQITSDVDRFACGYCGREHIVKRSGGIVSLAPVVEGLSKVQAGVDKTASELAIVRLKGEIEQLAFQINQLPSDRPGQVYYLLGGALLVMALVGLFASGGLFLVIFFGAIGVFSLFVGYLTANKAISNPEPGRLKVLLQQKNLELARHREVVGHK